MTRSKKILNIFTAVIVGLFLACTVASFAIRARTQPKVETTQAWEYDFSLGQDYAQILTVPPTALLSETRSFTDEEGTEYTWEQYYVYVATSSLGLFGEVFDVERINVRIFAPKQERYGPKAELHCYSDRDHMNEPLPWDWSFFENGYVVFLAEDGSIYSWDQVSVTGLDRVEEGMRVWMENNEVLS